ncbi:Zn(2)-C6 fungal-type DNA-binding domain [Fusarium oxysporum f. sp. vasinfectum]|nr:Zn(2)-C6 fungal-type DNA-binding domain [Fusarium oxysporum f. sp. vasinfectum]
MANAPGRPSKACDVCKKQKVRCSGERPSCKRCVRLKNTCEYGTNLIHPRQKRNATRAVTANGASQSVGSRRLAPVALSANLNAESISNHAFFQGIAPSLVNTLVELYFDNVYQSTLLLHKAIFMQSLADQTVKPHILLSICAWGANFYRNETGKATLKEQGLMTKWAKKAGALVFQDAEELSDDNLVTFCNLSLFWHSQGSWRISYLHKGNACQLLHINGTGPKNGSSLEAELRRRRFWACYLFHCFSCEKLFRFEAIADVENLPLPWSEEDFAVGSSHSAIATIANGVCLASIFGELIRGLNLWSSVVTVVKSDGDLNLRVQEIFRVENNISSWWNNVPGSFKLDAPFVTSISQKDLPKIILTNLVYHQSLCALHSSIIPLFCWSKGDKTYSSARQLSAQVAFDHATAISSLISAILTASCPLSSMPIFVAYAAYSSCAIQIPFLWCSELSVRERAQSNIDANVKMIQGMSNYWKLASLLQLYVRCLHNVHKRNPPRICGEPKYMNISALVDFDVDASLAKSSILQFAGMLRSDENGYVKAGDETSDPTIASVADSGDITLDCQASRSFLDHSANTNNPNTTLPQTPNQFASGPSEWPTLDIFNSLIDADMAGLFPFIICKSPSQSASPGSAKNSALTMISNNTNALPLLAPADFKALHPMGAAPVITDGSTTLAESCACIEYISHKYANGSLFLPPSHPAYADFLYWWHYVDGTLQTALGRIMLIRSAKLSDDNPVVQFGKVKSRQALKLLDERVKNNEWLAGEEFTAADIMVMFPLTTMRYFSPYSLEEYPNILKYLERIAGRKGFKKTMEKIDNSMELSMGASPPQSPFKL